MRVQRRVLPIAIALLGASGCANDAVVAPGASALSEFVVGPAAAALRADGTFERVDPSEFGGLPIISKSQAAILARAYVGQYGWLEATWSQIHGAPVVAKSLAPCGSVQFVSSPYEPITVAVSQTTRKLYGPRLWVTMCSPTSVPQLLVAVSALATDVQLSSNGGLIAAPDHQVTFVATPLPAGWTVPLSAEEAAIATARISGRRVASVPIARAVEGVEGAVVAAWSSLSEKEVQVMSAVGGATRSERELTIAKGMGLSPAIQLADSSVLLDPQTSGDDLQYSGTGVRTVPIQLTRTPSARVRLVAARVVK